MTQTLFDFSELFVDCIHQADFTNAIKKEEIKLMFANFLRIIQFCSNREWKEFARETNHCHEVKDEWMKGRIGKLINWDKKEIAELERKHVWQIPLGKEARLFGILEKNKPIKNTNLFRSLLFDPNHKTYRKSGKNVLATLKDLVCLFSEEEECQEVLIQKSLKKRKKLK